MILVTGATGNNGLEFIKALSARGVTLKAMTRDGKAPADTLKTPNVTVVTGDFDEPQSLVAARQGIQRAFLLTNSGRHAKPAASDAYADVAG